MSNTYYSETKRKSRAKLKRLLMELPPYCGPFFRAKRDTLEPRTLCGYAEDLTLFFRHIHSSNSQYCGMEMKEIPIDAIKCLEVEDIEDYLESIESYKKDGRVIKNGESGKQRKLASLRTFFRYMCKKGELEKDPTSLTDMPKLHEKEIVILSKKEKEKLISVIMKGWKYKSYQEQASIERNRLRDMAIIMVLLGTGIRVSELVGLDIADVDLVENKLNLIRKGGNEDHVYFNVQVKDALNSYIKENGSGSRADFLSEDGEQQALFLSRQHKRLTVRSIEKMVKVYANKAIGENNRISPHKMRSTFGTGLYETYPDIELVSKVLGHASIVTAQKHYVKFPEERKKQGAIKVL